MSNKAIAQALMKSFHKWGQTGRHSVTYKNTHKKSFRVFEDYLMQAVKPSAADYNIWYVKNHMKYSRRIAGDKHVIQDDIRRLQELTYKFFEARGRAQHAATVAAQKENSGQAQAGL